MDLCVQTALLGKPSEQRNSKRTAADFAVGEKHQQQQSYSSQPNLQWRHEPKSARHDVEENAGHYWFDAESQNTIWQRQ